MTTRVAGVELSPREWACVGVLEAHYHIHYFRNTSDYKKKGKIIIAELLRLGYILSGYPAGFPRGYHIGDYSKAGFP